MLVIRDEQMRALGEGILLRFKRSLAAELSAHYAVEQPVAERAVNLGLERSARYGILERSEISRYVHLMQRLGEDFDTDEEKPWAGFLLGHPELAPKVKLDLLETKVKTLTPPEPTLGAPARLRERAP